MITRADSQCIEELGALVIRDRDPSLGHQSGYERAVLQPVASRIPAALKALTKYLAPHAPSEHGAGRASAGIAVCGEDHPHCLAAE